MAKLKFAMKKFYYSDLPDYEVSAQAQLDTLLNPAIQHNIFTVGVKRNGEEVASLMLLADDVLGLVTISLVRETPQLDTVIGRVLLMKREDLSS